jgi:hypothetical protein
MAGRVKNSYPKLSAFAVLEREMKEPTFDIFYGTSDKNAIWLEAVEGLSAARERMEEIAVARPGQCFLFSSGSHTILARTEIFRKVPESLPKGRGSAAEALHSKRERWMHWTLQTKAKRLGWQPYTLSKPSWT